MVVFLLGGIVLSFIFPASNAISKSGSLIVVVGVWFAMLDFSEVAKKTETFTALTFGTICIGAFSKFPEASKLNPESKDKLIEHLESELTKDLKETLEKTKKNFLYIEAVIVVVGTLVNGFGDLMQEILFFITT